MNTTVMQMCETLKAQTRNEMKIEIIDKMVSNVERIEKILFSEEAKTLVYGSTGYRYVRMNLIRTKLWKKVQTYWEAISIINEA